MKQLDEYNIFNDLGKNIIPPKGSKKISVHLIYVIKHDIRHKSRCVADGHLTEVLLDSLYLGGVSLRGLRIFLA